MKAGEENMCVKAEELRGLPLDQKVEILRKEGLVVEGTCANEVNEVTVEDFETGERTNLKVAPMVIFEAGKPTITMYQPLN